MRNFSFTGLSTTVVFSGLALTALAGCRNDPPRLVDAHVTPDAGGGGVDMGMGGVDMGMGGLDMGMARDMGTMGGACTYGGGCNLTSTSSCPPDSGGARQGCYPDMTAPACHPAGTVAVGGACTALNDCDAGSVCLGTGTCAKLCCSATDCPTGQSCTPLGDGSGNPLPNGVGFCHAPTACTPVPNTGCAAMQQCTTTAADGSTDCFPTGPVAEGGDCSSDNCAAGLGCFNMGAGTAGHCYRFCRRAMGTTSNPDCTGTATTCGAGLGTTYGLCM